MRLWAQRPCAPCFNTLKIWAKVLFLPNQGLLLIPRTAFLLPLTSYLSSGKLSDTPVCALSCVQLWDPMDCSSPGFSVHRILQARILEWVAMPSSRDLPNSGTEPRSPASQVDSLSSELPGKSKNSGVGCHFLLQGTFPTQGSNLGLLNCKQILYHLSHQGSPYH